MACFAMWRPRGKALYFLNESVAGNAQGMSGSHPYLTGPKATGGQQEYGVPVAGTWDTQVARLAGESESSTG